MLPALELNIEVHRNSLIYECSSRTPNINTIQDILCSDVRLSMVDSYGNPPLILHLFHSYKPDPDIITLLIKISHMNQRKNKPDFRMTALLYALNNDCSSRMVFERLSTLPVDSDNNKTKSNYKYIERKYFNLIDLFNEAVRKIESESILKYKRPYNTLSNLVTDVEKQFYSQTYQDKLKKQTSLYHTLEEYIIETRNPDVNVISKIIDSYRESRDISYISPNTTLYSDIPNRLVDLSLMDAINVFYVAAAKRCSIEVFQVLLFDYGIDIAEQFGVNIMDVLAGNYILATDLKGIKMLIPFKSKQNILMSYIMGQNTLHIECPLNSEVYVVDIGNSYLYQDITIYVDSSMIGQTTTISTSPIDLDTFKYLTTIVNLNHRQHQYKSHRGDTYLHNYLPPLMGIINSPIVCQTDLLLRLISIYSETDGNINDFDQHGDGQNPLMEYIFIMSKYNQRNGEGMDLDLRVVKALANAGLDINLPNYLYKKGNVLMQVVNCDFSNTLEIFETLIELGADLYMQDSFKNIPLHSYMSKDISKYSQVAVKQYTETLVSFISMHDPEKMRSLNQFKNLLDLYLTDRHSLDEVNIEVLQALFQFKTDNYTFQDDFMRRYIIDHKLYHIDLIKKLIDLGIDINYKNPDDGCTPFLIAVSRHQSPDILKTLVDCGANVGDEDLCGYNAFMKLCSWDSSYYRCSYQSKTHVIQIYRYLVSFFPLKSNDKSSDICITNNGNTIDVNTTNNTNTDITNICDTSILIPVSKKIMSYTGKELLMYCSTTKVNVEIVNKLLESKYIDVNHTNTKGYNALMLLLKNKKSKCYNIYHWHGQFAEIHIDDNGNDISMLPPEHCSNNAPYLDIIQTLINAKIDLNYKNDNASNCTALYYATSKHYSLEILKMLIENEANITNIHEDEEYSDVLKSYKNSSFRKKTYQQSKKTYQETLDYLKSLF